MAGPSLSGLRPDLRPAAELDPIAAARVLDRRRGATTSADIATAIATHEAAADPHTAYLLEMAAALLYQPKDAELDVWATKAAPSGTVVGHTDAIALTNKTFDAASNTVSNLATSMFAANVVDTDTTLTANSDTRLASQKAVKAYADALIAANDAMVYRGATDCSANPNYPAANAGDTYRVSVAGKIGGASGVTVDVGDFYICNTDGTAAGNHATVGANWNVIQTNVVGVYYAGGTDVAVSDGGTGVSTITGLVKGNGTSPFTQAVAGTDYIAANAILADLGGVTQAADKIIYFDTSSTAATTDLTSHARQLLDDTSFTAMRATLSLGSAALENIGTSGPAVPLLSTQNNWALAQIMPDLLIDDSAGNNRYVTWRTSGVARWTAAANAIAEGGANSGSNWALHRYDDAGASLADAISINRATGVITLGVDLDVTEGGTGASTPFGARSNLGLVIGADVQAWDPELDVWATKAAPSGTVVGHTDAIALTNKTFNAASNTVSNLATSMFAANVVDTDTTLTANSDTRLASQKATKTYVDGLIAANDAMVFKGVIDCSANPNYPAADRGHTYRVSVAGLIGGGSGASVEAGDLLLCLTDGTASGNHATVGTSWSIVQSNVDGAVTGQASSVDGEIALFSGTSGKVIKRATPTGLLKATSGVLAQAVAGTDYYNPGGANVAIADGGTSADTPVGALDALFVQGANIASATTTDLSAATGNFVSITGTTTITGFGTCNAGVVRILRFSGALTLTHNASSLILPGGANIATASGDTAIFCSLGAGDWRCILFSPAGALPVNRGGTGAAILTGLLTGNGTGAITGGATISNADWSGTDLAIANGGTGGSTEIAAMDNLFTASANIASAGTTDLATATGLYVTITGTTTITAFGTEAAGVIRFLRFSGALTLTHNATSMILPDGVNIVTVAGDMMIFLSEGSGNWRCLHSGRRRAAGIVNVAAGEIVATDLQAAVNELDTEKFAKAGGTLTGGVTLRTGSATAATFPLKFVAGTLMTAAEAGAREMNGNGHYATGTIRVGVGGAVYTYLTGVQATTSEIDLMTDTFAANVINGNGSVIKATYAGTMVGHASRTRQFRVYFGGTLILDSGATVYTAGGDWSIEVEIIRTGATTARTRAVLLINGVLPLVNYEALTSRDFTATNILKMTGQCGAGSSSGDITGTMGSVQFLPPGAV